MQSQTNQLTVPVADNANLSLALGSFNDVLFRAAEENINMATEGGEGYTALERRAMIAAEALRLTSGMDLAAILTRGEIIAQIQREGLISVHPNGYADLTALAREQGISVGELSDTRALCEIIFPYITNVLGRSLAEIWAEIGKSSMRELVPALRSLITGEEAAHGSVRTAVETLLNNAAAELITEGVPQDELEVDDVRMRAVIGLLQQGATLPTRELRRTVRPTRTPPVQSTTMSVAEEEWFTVLHITSQDQYDMLMRLLDRHFNNVLINGENATPTVRSLRNLFGG